MRTSTLHPVQGPVLGPALGMVSAGLASGALVALSLPPFGWWPLGWLGFAAFSATLVGKRWSQRCLVGGSLGLVQYGIGLAWVHEFSIPGMILLVIAGVLFSAGAAALVRARSAARVWVSLPVALTLAEWARDRFPFGGFPLAAASLGQATSPLLAAARIGGGLLVAWEVVALGAALAWAGRSALEAVRCHTYMASARRALRGGLLAAMALVVAVPLVGSRSPSGGRVVGVSRVALVQGGGPRGTRAIRTNPQVVFRRQMQAAQAITAPVDLVVFPEGVLQSHGPFTATAEAAEVSALATRLRATVMVGVEQDVGVDHYVNEAVVWGPQGGIVAIYQKNHLVPFGEYVPLRGLVSHLADLRDVPYDAIPGHGPGFVSTPAGPLGVMISYEVFFDGRARGAVLAGGQLLVVPTNTASYRSTQVPAEEVAADRLRAEETGRWLVQATPTGYSLVASADAKVVQRSHLGRQEVVEATVPKLTGRTWYVDLGDVPIASGAVLVLGAAWWDRDRWRALAKRPVGSPDAEAGGS